MCSDRIGLLDICTGPGFGAGAADAIGATAAGIDLAPSMIATAKERFPRINFRVGDALALDAPDGSYDAAICNFGILHFTDPGIAYGEAFRVLKPGGRYAFSQWAFAPHQQAGQMTAPDIILQIRQDNSCQNRAVHR